MIDHATTFSAAALFVVAAAFMLYFATERYWTATTMGKSLMVMACGVLILSSQGVAYQVLGPDYPGREWFVIGGRCLVIVAFVQRMWALHHARLDDYGQTVDRVRRP